MSLKEQVLNGQKVHFKYYRKGILFYETDLGLLFEVPTSDTGNGTFNAEEKALNFMRWIRPQLERNEKARREAVETKMLGEKCLYCNQGRYGPTDEPLVECSVCGQKVCQTMQNVDEIRTLPYTTVRWARFRGMTKEQIKNERDPN
jgi:hypothetical protein